MLFSGKPLLLVTLVVFIGVGLLARFSHLWQAECFCSPSNKSFFSKNGPTEGFPVHSKDYHKGNNPHNILNLKSIIEGNTCLWIEVEDDKFYSINQKYSKVKNPLSRENKIYYLDEISNPTLTPRIPP